jgi:hypothetical protein
VNRDGPDTNRSTSSSLSRPSLGPKNPGDGWRRYHFIYLVPEGLKRVKVKPLYYSQVTTVQQGPDESLSAFLQHLKDTIQKHTTVDPESQVGEVLLKEKFLTHSAPDIHRKLQKSVAEEKKIIGPTNATSHVCIL